MSVWFANQAKANPDLFRVIYDFNCRPQNWIHPEVMNSLPHSQVIQALSNTNHGSAHVAAWLASELDLDPHSACWDFEEPRLRLALLSSSTLNKLACYAGAVAFWSTIATIISRDELHEIKAAIGEEAYSFSLRRGRMIMTESEDVVQSKEQSLKEDVLSAGWRMIATAVNNERLGVLRRLTLKLPSAARHQFVNHVTAQPDASAEAWRRLRKINPEVLSEGEYKCFA